MSHTNAHLGSVHAPLTDGSHPGSQRLLGHRQRAHSARLPTRAQRLHASRCVPVALFRGLGGGSSSSSGVGGGAQEGRAVGVPTSAATATADPKTQPLVILPADGTVFNEFDSSLEQMQWPDGPIVSCGGGGIFFFWMLGVMKYLSSRYDLREVTFIGASAGGLIAALTACEVDLDAAVQRAYQMASENRIWDRPLGLMGVWGPLVRQWLDELLPEDAHVRCSGGRVRVIATELSSMRQVYLQDFATRDELLDACMASAHVPLVLDGRPFTKHKGKLYMDGSLQDFIVWDNSPLLKCDGRAFLLDYSQDETLAAERFSFLRIRMIDEVLRMIRCGYKYARRMDVSGGLDPFLGGLRNSGSGAIRTGNAARSGGSGPGGRNDGKVRGGGGGAGGEVAPARA